MKRRTFLNSTIFVGAFPLITPKHFFTNSLIKPTSKNKFPISICTWNFKKANEVAGKALEKGMDSLNAAILGAQVEEDNPSNSTVGFGGAPDREGNVTLDACVMDHKNNCGAVLAVENVVHVASLARDVMEKTPHVMLTGKGAESFARSLNYPSTVLLTKESKKAWEKWKKEAAYEPIINIENHDTIGILCIDKQGNLSGACSTSGLAYKMKGRIGDSPIIGAGLFIDNEVGGAVATGMGEEVVKTVGSFLIVELMRQGYTPQQACDEAIRRIVSKEKGIPNFQVAYIAIDKNGNVGSRSIHDGFSYMEYRDQKNINNLVNPY